MHSIFVYGTLLNDEILNLFIESHPIKHDAKLLDYRRVSVVGRVYPAIFPEQGSEVEGVLITNLSASDIQSLKEYEGSYYSKERVRVSLADNASKTCETFVFKTEYHKLLSNKVWCNEYFRRRHLDNFLKDLF